MKFVLVGPVYPYRGGIAHHTNHLARALKGRGHEVLVISFKRQYPTWLYPGATDRDPSADPIQTEAEYLLDPILPWTWRAALRRIEGYAPNLVVIQWWTTFWALPFAYITHVLSKRNIPATYLIHNVLPHEPRLWDKWLARLALGNVNHTIVQSPSEKERLLRLIPSMDPSLCAMPVFPKFSTHQISKPEAKRKLNLEDRTPVLLFFGIVRPYKGLHILLDALARLKIQGIKPYLMIAGEFWEDKHTYTNKIEELHLSNQIRVDDRYIPNEEAETYFLAADMVVTPYTAGTQSAVAAQALGYDLPVILTPQLYGGLSEAHSGLLYVIPPGDSEALAATIKEVSEKIASLERPQAHAQDEWGQLVDILNDLSGSQVSG